MQICKKQSLRLIDDSHDVQSSNRASIFRCLSLSIIEVCRNRHHGMRHLLAKVGFSRLLHLDQHHCRDLFGSEGLRLRRNLDLNIRLVVLVGDFEWVVFDVVLDRRLVKASTNQTLDIEHCILGIRCKLVLGCVADQSLTFWCESNIGRRDTISLVIGYDLYTTILEDSNTKITRLQ